MRPSREPIRQADQTYFITFQTAQRQCFFRNERWAIAFLNTLARYQDSYALHDFVIMPDHVHLLLSPGVPLERAIQLVKGGFSFNARRAFEWKGNIWQPGFSDHASATLEIMSNTWPTSNRTSPLSSSRTTVSVAHRQDCRSQTALRG